MMTKQELRHKAKQYRAFMHKEEKDTASEVIAKKALKFVREHNLKSVHCYTSIDQLQEVDTKKIMQELNKLDCTVHTFAKVGNDWVNTDVRTGAVTEERTYDVIIVPTLAADAGGNRLGYGGGFYDRFLLSQRDAHTIGLCFLKTLFVSIPVESHDVVLQQIIHE